MSIDYSDIRDLVLRGGIKPNEEAIYVERLGGWLNIRELMSNEKSQVMQQAVNQKTGTVDLDVLNAGIAVRSLRYPAPGVQPKPAVEPEQPADNASDEDKAKYEKDVQAYQAQLALLAQYAVSYPGVSDATGSVAVFPHPKAGQLIFQLTDRDAFSKALPGAVLEEIAAPAMVLSGFGQDVVKKTGSVMTGDSTTTTPSPTSSESPTLNNSSVA